MADLVRQYGEAPDPATGILAGNEFFPGDADLEPRSKIHPGADCELMLLLLILLVLPLPPLLLLILRLLDYTPAITNSVDGSLGVLESCSCCFSSCRCHCRYCY